MMKFEAYRDRYTNLAMQRRDGILEVRFHTDGGPLIWNGLIHEELPMALAAIGADPGNRVIILTGTGDTFCTTEDATGIKERDYGEGVERTGWNLHEKIAWEGRRILQSLLDIEVPIIAAVNGPAWVHAELAVMSDIVLAAEGASFADEAHVPRGLVPGDGVHFVWPMLLGPNRARYFLLTGEHIGAAEAQRLNFVAEVLPADGLMARAWELAETLNARERLLLRYSRVLLTQPFKKALLEELGHGIALEGIAIAALRSARGRPGPADSA